MKPKGLKTIPAIADLDRVEKQIEGLQRMALNADSETVRNFALSAIERIYSEYYFPKTIYPLNNGIGMATDWRKY